MADAKAGVNISTDGHRSYTVDVSFGGNAGLTPTVVGVHVTYKCESDHQLTALIKIFEQAIKEMNAIKEVGRCRKPGADAS